jgi:hypothetical protein
MALIGNNSDTLLHGLSSFWHRFFRDIGDLQRVYEGTEILLGQVYLNLMSDVLNTSIVEAPLFRKEFYKLITVREDQLAFKERGTALAAPVVPTFYGNPGADRYVFESDTFYGEIPRLQDVIFAPKTALETGTDYRVAGGEIQFKVDPTAPVLPGFAHRRVVVAIGGKFSSSTVNWISAGVEKGDTLYYSESTNLGVGAVTGAETLARTATIVHVTATHLSVSVDTPFPTFPTGAAPSGFSWRVERRRDDGTLNLTLPLSTGGAAPFLDDIGGTGGTVSYTLTLEVAEIAFWAVDALIDDLTLYNTYGYFFTGKQLSTETYRALIRGLMQLYILGPALARLESALNLTAELPTAREEGELLLSYDNGILEEGLTGELLAGEIFQVPTAIFTPTAVGGYIKITASDFAANIGSFNIVAYISPTQVKLPAGTPFVLDAGLEWLFTKTNVQLVTTDRNAYEYPLDTPIRDDVKDSANFGVLTFEAFEAITTAIRVTDYVQDPEWWHTITIPQELLPEWSSSQRVVTPQLYPSVLGPVGNADIGDPGFYIGATELGDNDLLVTSNAFHYKAAFILMDRFLKLHTFAVLVDQSVRLTNLLVNDLQKILKDVKPVHTALYFRPLTGFRDVVDITDDDLFLVHLVRRRLERIGVIDNQWTIGSTWNIGDTWAFSGASGGAVTINPGATGMYVAIGGSDPSIQPANAANVPPATDPPYMDDIAYPTDVHWIDRALHVYPHA